jgi:hypothetical protein
MVQTPIGAAPHIYICDWKGRLATFAPCWWLKEIHTLTSSLWTENEYLHPACGGKEYTLTFALFAAEMNTFTLLVVETYSIYCRYRYPFD